MKISVIIPTLNEASTLAVVLHAIRGTAGVETIVVDGGSRDETVAIARGAADLTLSVPPSLAGRARQMNAGAEAASGEAMVFLHADSLLPPGGLAAVREALRDPGVVGGAFRLAIQSPRPVLRLIAGVANLRSRITRIPYGDQGLFVRRTVFERLGGFPDIPLMEDVELCRRLKREGRLAFLPEAILTSDRRWEREGVLYATLRNWTLVSLYLLGVSPTRLVRWYPHVR